MQFIIAALIGGLASGTASFVGRALLTLGIGFVTYTGATIALDSIKTIVLDSFQGLPAEVASFIAWLWLDKAVSLIFAATAAAVALRTGNGGNITKMEYK